VMYRKSALESMRYEKLLIINVVWRREMARLFDTSRYVGDFEIV
jgi:hypothetical protein